MSNAVVRAEHVSKCYRIGAIGSGTLKEDWGRAWARLKRRTAAREPKGIPVSGRATADDDQIWALRDVGFEIGRGEVLGIIGRNGAGKSTLLKIVSRITAPTAGEVKIKGRVASLLEVGTGFHPDLTGRENVFLNGAILGMSRADIRAKFDEIVEFAGVSAFIDTPVKRYSSGMYVRLAFGVAAHLDPEILVVDEVLAVGDIAFQRKCLGKMSEVTKGGRTILFVSHNMQAIRSLCPRSILIEDGRLVADGATDRVASLYHECLQRTVIDGDTAVGNAVYRRGSGHVRVTGVAVLNSDGEPSYQFEMGDTIRFRLSYRVLQRMSKLSVYVGLRSGISGELVTSTRHIVSAVPVAAGATGTVIVEYPEICIRPGEYPIFLCVDDTGGQHETIDSLTHPLVVASGRTSLHQDETSPLPPVGYFSLSSRMEILDHREQGGE
jgi:lipopolysaccharide transport system ATP-binding protein